MQSILLLLLNIFFTVLLGSFSLSAQAFPTTSPVPGGLILVELSPINSAKPRARFKDQEVAIVRYQHNWAALVGIPLNTKPGTHHLKLWNPFARQWQNFPLAIKAKKYRTQHLRIKNKNKVNPNKKSTQRIVREIKLKKGLRTRFTHNHHPSLHFIQPVQGRDSGRFGLKRFINGQKRNPHTGMDIAARQGTPIKASQAGRVIFTGKLFFSGNVVYIDHGQGIISLYAHLNRIKVRPQQFVKQGHIIGTVGKTGRATGPHLHWSMYLNGTPVDPKLFLGRP